ncbi:sigma-54-dependent Fis family transcriptional regulator [Clostridium lacusfryxellense]|uniref:sigma-54-dependent Fis family transcriptional regulator n=1 Tax=Clostridium lacusfryxellense TaxID=205328 RepID=UPI001C0CE7EA|nr:sigma-54-dependent Fis family transcriptional regulator [Clostridium lacusfryxellense]MBU3113536.1 sigma-54-dependent Fis family transcriptional regulator [Clostridium lacusfryxellense]
MPNKKLLDNDEDIIKKWRLFVAEGVLNKNGLRNIIFQSWERSKQYGIDPFKKDFLIELTKDDLKNKYKEFMPLLAAAKPFMQTLYNLIQNSDFMIRLTDRDGYVLDHIGEDSLIKQDKSLVLQDGYNIKEEVIGTNAIGLSLITGEPIQVLGGEHYLHKYHNWTSSACPIKDEKGSILGVLSITGHFEFVHPHTLGMVIAAANAIEKEMKLEYYNKRLKRVNEQFYQITESISEGIIRIDNQGNITSMNRFARKLLGYSVKEINNMRINDVLSTNSGKDIINVLNKGREYQEEELDFTTKMGRNKTCIVNVTPIKFFSSTDLGGVIITFKENKVVLNMINKIVGANARYTFSDIFGKSKSIAHSINLATIAAKTDDTILLQGESGTGKEMFTQAIHNASRRKDRPFVFLNCGAIPRDLVSSELFGYVEGAFTGAKRGGHPGKFELADGGTIFLDEIGDMPLDAQISLLRVLEERNVVRVGGHDVIPINVRVIAATNKDLKKEVDLGTFRSDLFYRINVMPIYIASLRERKEDIKTFIDYYYEKFIETNDKNINKVSQSFYEGMINYNWPGNVRELQNVMQLVLNVAENNSILTSKNLPSYIIYKENIGVLSDTRQLLTLDQIEKNAIMQTLIDVNDNLAAASRILGIGRSTLYRKIEKYNITI